MHRLLVLACSKSKVPAKGTLPALERYDGPAFRVLRKYLRENDRGALSIFILSAKHGLIPAAKRISDYDCRLLPDSARALRPQVLSAAQAAVSAKSLTSVGVCAGKDYQVALDGFAELIPAGVRLETIGGGQGRRLTALRQWLIQGA
jgi:hypothetical protein